MSVKIGSNTTALLVQRNLADAAIRLSNNFEKLSSGLRINQAADDAAGLAISQSLNASAKVYGQAIRNVNDGISLTNIAQGALQQLQTITQRQAELAEQSANGVYSNTQRQALNTEAGKLNDEFNRILRTTSFNGQDLLNGSSGKIRIQCGSGTNGSIAFTLPFLGTPVLSGDGTFDTGTERNEVLSLMLQDRLSIDDGSDFAIYSATNDYYVWFDRIGNGSGDPLDQGHAIRVDISSGPATPEYVAQAVASAINNDPQARLEFSATASSGGKATLTVLQPGNIRTPLDGGMTSSYSGTTFEITIPGNTSAYSCPDAVTSADLNGDGASDLITGELGALKVLMNNGNGTFEAAVTYSVGWFSNPISTDLNGDGAPDLAGISDNDTLAVLINNGNGTFKAAAAYTAGSWPNIFLSSDLNGDGVPDLVSADMASYTLSVLINNGDGTFKASDTYPVGTDSTGLISTDLNGDGVFDLASADYDDYTISVLINNGNGTFQPAAFYWADAAPLGLASADLNRDGAPDLVTGHDGGAGSLGVLINNGNGTFGAAVFYTFGNGAGVPIEADLNADGVPDLAVSDNGVLNVLINKGNGTFENAMAYTVGSCLGTPISTDLNGDGAPDLVIADSDSGTLSVLINNGNGTFKAAAPFSVGIGPRALISTDLNADGVPDLLSTDAGSNTATVLLANTETIPTENGGLKMRDLSPLNLSTSGSAKGALNTIQSRSENISTALGNLGAAQSRLAVALNTLGTTRENEVAASSRITDVDVAQEAADMTRNQITQQVGAAILAQANQQPQIALSLLRNG